MKRIFLSATALVVIPLSAGLAQAQQSVPAIQANGASGKPVSLTRTPPPSSAPPAGQASAGADATPTAPPASIVAPAALAASHPQASAPSAATPAAAVPAPPPAKAPVNAPAKAPAPGVPVDLGSAAGFQQDEVSGPPGQPSKPQYPMHPPPAVNPISQAPVALGWKERRSVAISRAWRHRRSAPATGADGAVRFTYGATQPTVVCAPLTVCLIKLEPGEKILPDGLQNGDTSRWRVTPTFAGGDQTVLVIKPTDAALETTLAVMTDRRVYTIRLLSVASEARSMPVSEFDYPNEDAARMAEYQAQLQQRIADNTLTGGRSIASLDFSYKISGDSPPWRPERVYSDGIHTFIQFPDAMRSSDSPSLLALAHDGTWFANPTGQVINYRREGNTYVVDRVIDRAELVVGVGDNQTRVVITHKGPVS